MCCACKITRGVIFIIAEFFSIWFPVQDGGMSSIFVLSLISSTTTSCVCQVYDGSDSENSATNYTAVNTGIGDDESHA